VKAISNAFPDVIISVDTFRSNIAEEAVDAGAHIVNDISGGMFDEKMLQTVGRLNTPYIIMHTTGRPDIMQQHTHYQDIIMDINRHFVSRINAARQYGIKDIIIDPGFGFGKDVQQNYELLARLPYFAMHNLPVMVGISRKSMIYKYLNIRPEDSLAGTIALNTIAILHGASILRVHDVREAFQVVSLLGNLKISS
jgi:dihydropteroate synthase